MHEEDSVEDYFIDPSSIVHESARIGSGTMVWHFCHIMKDTRIGSRCSFGQNCHVGEGVLVGDNVKVQNNVSIYSGTTIEDDVFLGPSCVLTNVTNPRSQVKRRSIYERTLIRRGTTIGANATIVCGIALGQYSFIGAGAVVVHNVADYRLILGNPGRAAGWMSRHGHRLGNPNQDGIMRCPESGFRYKEIEPGLLRCLDLDEDEPLPPELAVGHHSYDEFKVRGAVPTPATAL